MAQTYMDSNGLLRKYGPTKAVSATGGDYSMPGELRVAEFTVDLSTLTTSPVIQSDILTFGTGMMIEEVEVVADTLAADGTSFSIGLIQLDRTSVLSNTAIVNAMVLASVDTLGEKTVLRKGSTYAGGYIGTTSASPGYFTALAAGTFSAGVVRIRVKYRGIGTITY